MARPLSSLLLQLRNARPGTDWRRDRPHENVPAWREALRAQVGAGGATVAEQAEAEALLARLTLDPLATLRHFVAFRECATSPPAMAHRMMLELVSHWGDAMSVVRGRGGAQEVRHCGEEALRLLRQFAASRPADAQAQLLLASFIRHSAGIPAAVNHIAGLQEPPPELVREYFDLLIERALRVPDADSLLRLFTEPLPFRAPVSLDMLRFRLHRAVIVQSLRWSAAARSDFGDAALRAALQNLPDVDPDGELATLLRLMPLLQPDEQAHALLGLMACAGLWRSPAAERVRQALLEAAMGLVPRLDDNGLLTTLLARLIEYAPQSIKFWEQTGLAEQLHTLVGSVAGRIRPSQRHYFMGITAFPLQRLDVVAREYAAATEVEPTASRFTSYLDPRQVALSRDTDILNASAFDCDTGIGGGAGGDGMMLATSADEAYFRRYAVRYATSLRQVGGARWLHFHLIGRPAGVAEQISQIREILPGTRVTVSSEPVLANRAFFFATARFLRMQALLDHAGVDLMMTDIDVTWHAPPDAWAAALPEADVGLRIFDAVRPYVMQATGEVILRYPRTKLWECTSASSILLRRNAAGRRFSELLAQVASAHLRRFLDKPGTHWFIDQNILSAVFAHALRHEDIRIGNLDVQGTPYSPFAMLDGEMPRRTYGRHWIAQTAPFVAAAG